MVSNLKDCSATSVLAIFWQGEFAGWDLWKNPATAELSNVLMYPQGAGFLKAVSLPDMPTLKQFINELLVTERVTPCNEVLGRFKTD